MDTKKNNDRSRELKEMLLLRYEPIAIKMIESEEQIPQNAIHPYRDLGKHIALCQAFAMTKRNKKTFFMDKSSEWCWNPLIGFGLVECAEGSKAFEVVCKNLGIRDIESAREFFAHFPTLPFGKYLGIVSAPLNACEFEPDVVLIYANNAQLRNMVWAIKNITGKLVETQLDAIDSCVYSCVVPLNKGEYRVTLPDMGEYERASAEEDEIILSVPKEHIDELITGLRTIYERGMGYPDLSKEMTADFARPAFYNELYEIWGLEQGEEWKR